MPEGPSIVIVRDILKPFTGMTIKKTQGNAAIDKKRLEGEKIVSIRSWGKHLLICFKSFTLRVHFLMFGTYLVDERKKTPLKLSLQFGKREINFYTCSIVIVDGPLKDSYDFTADIMGPEWSSRKTGNKMKAVPDRLVCDVLMDQEIFPGVGNIIKNEVLFRIRVHPESVVGALTPAKTSALLKETRKYPFEFLKWKKADRLSQHLKAYEQKECPRDHDLIHKAITGKSKRASYFCNTCQVLYLDQKRKGKAG